MVARGAGSLATARAAGLQVSGRGAEGAVLSCTGSHGAHVCAHTPKSTHRTSRLHRAAHARVLPGRTVYDGGWVCGPLQGMTTCPGDSHPRGRGSHRACTSWSPLGLSLRGGVGGGAVFTCLRCSLGSTDQSQLSEKVGVSAEQRPESCLALGSWAGPSVTGQGRGPRGCRGVRTSWPCHGPPSGEGRRNVGVCR